MKRKVFFQRLKNRKLRRKRKIKAGFFAFIFCVVLVFILIYFVFFSNLFIIKTIEVSGNKNIQDEEIKNTISENISKPYLMFEKRNNIFLIENNKLELNLLKKFPEIKSVEIKNSFPNTLKVNISEKNPALIWCRIDDCYYVDIDGAPFMPYEKKIKTNKKLVKIIEDLREDNSIEKIVLENNADENAKNAEKTNEGLLDDLEINKNKTKNKSINALPKIKIGEKVSDREFIKFAIDLNEKIKNVAPLKIRYYKTKGTNTRELTAYTEGNVKIYFNAVDNVDSQIENLKELLNQVIDINNINDIDYIYLKSGDKIFWKSKEKTADEAE